MKRQVRIGPLSVGGGAPVRVESMLKTPLSDRAACLAQCESLLRSGCELARVALPRAEDAGGLAWLLPRTELPLMADIHFDPALALAAMAAGCRSIRINPGNMPLGRLNEMIRAAKDAGVVIRIGANGGSLSGRQLDEAEGDRAAALFLAVREQAELLLENGFEDIILSAKSSSVSEMVRANVLIARAFPGFPLHIGLTEAGPGDGGIVKSTAGISALLSQGIGDTLRVSLTDEPEREVRVGYEILKALSLRSRGVNLISCPTCGRRRADVMRLVALIEPMLEGLPDGTSVAVMGCEVNGPKEAKHARLGIAGTPSGAVLFREGRVVGEYAFEALPEVLPRFFAADGKVDGGQDS
ncbi:flavodoxin-dependent (E)-4-hydroxy-3-methylbut-2-enyl-diphosphate synthase [Fretibacterium sp. OH1220_COT-178]|uniref:flavodoxin-dependent (E)-4-hydroxy-3-methylbut-2-enyl-diphosphate synthase n=1 Tax=Fretibacterium sp. OH1220_COT-178 TaxID=2491047 RepID=UPI000F5EAD45|nr:flavodoxin-dependent (E)-4-hydroxy-3-methylbut-2-enyl-diphosphate synthase [Fretibacterium sp. OH1220_COT-178]RRD64767.1 flavodoxin-dependent (E)-4-hydroxy-3-methylbut-2-enyl-diphosphate synthase [Fretibacterium sp. OH1220_COT-178]